MPEPSRTEFRASSWQPVLCFVLVLILLGHVNYIVEPRSLPYAGAAVVPPPAWMLWLIAATLAGGVVSVIAVLARAASVIVSESGVSSLGLFVRGARGESLAPLRRYEIKWAEVTQIIYKGNNLCIVSPTHSIAFDMMAFGHRYEVTHLIEARAPQVASPTWIS
jgi:hypothetical protein